MERRKVLIIDDELPALDILKTFVERRPEFKIELATTRYDEAVEYLNQNDLDLLIVDLDLRVATGYDLMDLVEKPTQIIVCTATDSQGMQAIAAGAIDYVVKMVEEERFNQALDLVLTQLQLLEDQRRFKSYPASIGVSLAPDDTSDDRKFREPEPNQYAVVRVADLVYARSFGKTTRLFLSDGTEILTKKMLGQLLELLSPNVFVRIQRGYIVNRHEIEEYNPGAEYGTKNWWVLLRQEGNWSWPNDVDKGRLPVGEKYRYRLEKILAIRP